MIKVKISFFENGKVHNLNFKEPEKFFDYYQDLEFHPFKVELVEGIEKFQTTQDTMEYTAEHFTEGMEEELLKDDESLVDEGFFVEVEYKGQTYWLINENY